MPSHLRILAMRLAKGLTQEELVARLKPSWPAMSESMLSKIENDFRAVKADEIPHFAKALGCRPEELLDPLP